MFEDLVSCYFFSSRRRHTRCLSDWSSDVCSSDLHCSSLPASAMTWTAWTPFIFSAALVSMEVMRACGCGQVRENAYSKSLNLRSEVYLARPAALIGPSTRLGDVPMTLRASIGGQL